MIERRRQCTDRSGSGRGSGGRQGQRQRQRQRAGAGAAGRGRGSGGRQQQLQRQRQQRQAGAAASGSQIHLKRLYCTLSLKSGASKPKLKPKVSHESPLPKRKVGQAAASMLLLSEHGVGLFNISEYAKTASCLRAFTEQHIKLHSNFDFLGRSAKNSRFLAPKKQFLKKLSYHLKCNF